METPAVHRIHIETETVFHEGGPVAAKPYLRGFAAALAENPFAGRYVASISDMMDALTPLGMMLSKRLLDALGVGPSEIDAYGKGAIVGAGGETEHAALWHVPGGYAMRELLGDAKAIVPSTKKLGGIGARLDVPLTHINASYVRSHFDAMECGVPGAPAANEIIYILTMASGGRVHQRVGGLQADEITGEDGLR